MQEVKQVSWFKRTFAAFLGIAALAALVYGLVRFRKLRSISKPEPYVQFKPSEQGLSEEEAARRRTDERAQARRLAEQEARWARRRRNIFSIFNLTILVLAISQILLKDLLGAMGTFATLLLNIAVNLFQEGRSAKQVAELAAKTRPMATVIREGRLKSIDQDEVVVGDILVAGRGDEVLADGDLIESADLTIDESMLGGKSESVTKLTGEPLQAGTNCTSGWAVYRVKQMPLESPAGEDRIAAPSTAQTLTPLQNIVKRVLFGLLIIAGIFYISLMLDVVRADILPPEILVSYREVMSIIFTIAPGGLFFMIVINYAVGSAEIARSDALVRNSLSIESLAQISTICLIWRGGMMGLNVELEMFPSQSDTPELPESRARQALGNYVHSVQENRFPLSILKQALEGEKRTIVQQARYLSIYGWEASTFSSKDMPGSYVIGLPDVLKPNLKEQKPAQQEKDQAASGQEGQGGIRARLRNWFRPGKVDPQKTASEILSDESKPADAGDKLSEFGVDTSDGPKKGGFLRRLRTRLEGMIRHRDGAKDQQDQQTDQEHPDEILRLMFAYSPSSQPIYDTNNQPQCPRELVPICFIKFVEQVRPEARKALQNFLDEDVAIKIMTDDEPMRALAIAHQLGIVEVSKDDSPVAAGDVISQWTPDQLKDAAQNKTIFASLSSNQMLQILVALKRQGAFVAVQSGSIADLQIMRQADLSITEQGSSPTVLNQADIILLKNSSNALAEVLRKGQRIVNGLMDVLRLNLTQIIYILILLVAMFASGGRIFYYHPTQGGAIALFTIAIPSIALSFWGSTVSINRMGMHKQLVHFVIPAALMTALCVVVIYSIFINISFSITYSQLVITHLLVVIGLLLVVFVQPPLRFLARGDEFSGDWRPTYIAAALFLIFQITTHIPLAQRLLKLAPLASPQDYLFVWGTALVWAILTLIVWRLHWLKRVLDWSSGWMVTTQE
jgi:magnesium-transporting ATPase (P-type)